MGASPDRLESRQELPPCRSDTREAYLLAALVGALVVLLILGGMVMVWHLAGGESGEQPPPVRLSPDLVVADGGDPGGVDTAISGEGGW